MEAKTVAEIAEMASGTLFGAGSGLVKSVSTDTRSIQPGQLFVALRGERFDGHDFLATALEQGAAAALVERLNRSLASLPQIQVSDALIGLQTLAKNYRTEFCIPVIGITGSNGKTSTKEMVAAVLGARFSVVKTAGNLNNHIGVPISVLRFEKSAQVAVLEYGMNHAGEVSQLIGIVRPDHAVITNIGVAHIEYLGSRQAIAREKSILAESVPSTGTVVLNAADDFAEWIAARCQGRVIRVGLKQGDIQVQGIKHRPDGEEFTLVAGSEEARVYLPVPGEHMIINGLQAVGVGLAFGLSLAECAAGLAKTALPSGRLQVKDLDAISIINDAYNANPDSMIAALKTVANLPVRGRRVAALGAMGELGSESLVGHQMVGKAVADNGFDVLIAVGDAASPIAQSAIAAGLARSRTVKTNAEAADLLNTILEPGDLLLLKGSRSAAVDQIIPLLEQSRNPIKNSST
ncbi:MAG: UDP-N-acetylmuramoyl-tripeptide--D-alanyl-D-alanine ligase [Verrucomicrobia bacterium]|nr:UDP-N-acetylmuramoyl-tripeptide--D-alanyl-D-alanine ligase [Verrucomicrobiota bacterium]